MAEWRLESLAVGRTEGSRGRYGKAQLAPTEVGYSSPDTLEIKSGVQVSDRIVVDLRGLKGDVVPVEVK